MLFLLLIIKLTRKARRKDHQDPEPVIEKPEIPEDLLCNICKDFLTDAVMFPCSGNSFCDECIRTFLLESEEHECPDCKEKDVSLETLISNRFLRNAVMNFKNETDYVKRLIGLLFKVVDNLQHQQINPKFKRDKLRVKYSLLKLKLYNPLQAISSIALNVPSQESVESQPTNLESASQHFSTATYGLQPQASTRTDKNLATGRLILRLMSHSSRRKDSQRADEQITNTNLLWRS